MYYVEVLITHLNAAGSGADQLDIIPPLEATKHPIIRSDIAADGRDCRFERILESRGLAV